MDPESTQGLEGRKTCLQDIKNQALVLPAAVYDAPLLFL